METIIEAKHETDSQITPTIGVGHSSENLFSDSRTGSKEKTNSSLPSSTGSLESQLIYQKNSSGPVGGSGIGSHNSLASLAESSQSGGSNKDETTPANNVQH